MASQSSGWQAGLSTCAKPRGQRALEIVGIVFAFIYSWPLAVGYLAWKALGYPGFAELRRFVDRGFENPLGGVRFAGPANPFRPNAAWTGSGNRAFDEYRRGEIERLERERRRLDDEAREFRDFVEELKRAKDREEFDAYMARRRANGPTSV